LGPALIGNVQTLRNEPFAIDVLTPDELRESEPTFGKLIEVEPGVFAEAPGTELPTLTGGQQQIKVFLRKRSGIRVVPEIIDEVIEPGQENAGRETLDPRPSVE